MNELTQQTEQLLKALDVLHTDNQNLAVTLFVIAALIGVRIIIAIWKR
jgi:hypothetical protein